jgi:hypothetical protein
MFPAAHHTVGISSRKVRQVEVPSCFVTGRWNSWQVQSADTARNTPLHGIAGQTGVGCTSGGRRASNKVMSLMLQRGMKAALALPPGASTAIAGLAPPGHLRWVYSTRGSAAALTPRTKGMQKITRRTPDAPRGSRDGGCRCLGAVEIADRPLAAAALPPPCVRSVISRPHACLLGFPMVPLADERLTAARAEPPAGCTREYEGSNCRRAVRPSQDPLLRALCVALWRFCMIPHLSGMCFSSSKTPNMRNHAARPATALRIGLRPPHVPSVLARDAARHLAHLLRPLGQACDAILNLIPPPQPPAISGIPQ